MISVPEAKIAVQDNTRLISPVNIPLQDASGLILADDVFSKIDFPPFDQSGMDGYAFGFDGWKGNDPLTLVGEVPAGTFSDKELKTGEVMRIFTGAPLPVGADTVEMQEKVTLDKD